jgi:hypothetical protein
MKRIRGLAGLAALALACASPIAPSPPPLDLFAPPAPDDMFTPLIRLWQASERYEAGRAAALAPQPSAEFAHEVQAFGQAQKLRAARETLRWIQGRSALRYRPDTGGDQWPTLSEMLARGVDDCDGLELVAFHVLRTLGFGEGELYRAVLRSSDAAQYHMVTLWFDAAPPSDPYVIDPTGWIARDLVRLSSLQSWRALRLFDEDQEFTALEAADAVLPAEVAGR